MKNVTVVVYYDVCGTCTDWYRSNGRLSFWYHLVGHMVLQIPMKVTAMVLLYFIGSDLEINKYRKENVNFVYGKEKT